MMDGIMNCGGGMMMWGMGLFWLLVLIVLLLAAAALVKHLFFNNRRKKEERVTESSLTVPSPNRLRKSLCAVFLVPVAHFLALAVALGWGIMQNPREISSAPIGKLVSVSWLDTLDDSYTRTGTLVSVDERPSSVSEERVQ